MKIKKLKWARSKGDRPEEYSYTGRIELLNLDISYTIQVFGDEFTIYLPGNFDEYNDRHVPELKLCYSVKDSKQFCQDHFETGIKLLLGDQ